MYRNYNNIYYERYATICTGDYHYIDIHLEMSYNCTLQNMKDKPVQRAR